MLCAVTLPLLLQADESDVRYGLRIELLVLFTSRHRLRS